MFVAIYLPDKEVFGNGEGKSGLGNDNVHYERGHFRINITSVGTVDREFSNDFIWFRYDFLEQSVENSRHPETPARSLGTSERQLLTPFHLDPGSPGNLRMSSKNTKLMEGCTSKKSKSQVGATLGQAGPSRVSLGQVGAKLWPS